MSKNRYLLPIFNNNNKNIYFKSTHFYNFELQVRKNVHSIRHDKKFGLKKVTKTRPRQFANNRANDYAILDPRLCKIKKDPKEKEKRGNPTFYSVRNPE